MIINTSEKAAEYKTGIEGWVDRHGRYWGDDERTARWSGCTHISCGDCGEPTPKGYTACESCREAGAIKRHAAREHREWDGETPLYSDATDEYLMNKDMLTDYVAWNNCNADDLRLIICDPVTLTHVADDYWCDDLPDECELPSDVEKALDALNQALEDAGTVAWIPGKYAAIVSL